MWYCNVSILFYSILNISITIPCGIIMVSSCPSVYFAALLYGITPPYRQSSQWSLPYCIVYIKPHVVNNNY